MPPSTVIVVDQPLLKIGCNLGEGEVDPRWYFYLSDLRDFFKDPCTILRLAYFILST